MEGAYCESVKPFLQEDTFIGKQVSRLVPMAEVQFLWHKDTS